MQITGANSMNTHSLVIFSMPYETSFGFIKTMTLFCDVRDKVISIESSWLAYWKIRWNSQLPIQINYMYTNRERHTLCIAINFIQLEIVFEFVKTESVLNGVKSWLPLKCIFLIWKNWNIARIDRIHDIKNSMFRCLIVSTKLIAT